jgi:membrane associated rhomboid family serine protease
MINVVVFLFWHFTDDSDGSFMAQNFLVSWTALAEGRYWVLLTSVFSHLMFFHLLLNMFVLNSFGSFLERALGQRFFLIFYLIAGIVGSFTHAFVSAAIVGKPDLAALGASGAISGLILLFALMFPKEKILILGIIPVPAIWGGLICIGIDVWGLSAQAGGGGLPIGHGAHLGGALAGVICYFSIIRPRLQEIQEMDRQRTTFLR